MDRIPTCRLLDLPAELRIRIYGEVLAPTGTLCLTATKAKRYAVTPMIGPGLLSTCRQIHHEARDIIFEQNRICLTIDCHKTAWPVIAAKQIPQLVLQRLQHLGLILDTATLFYDTYNDVDWRALTALVSLRTLQIAIVRQTTESNPQPAPLSIYIDLMAEIYKCIPQRTITTYGLPKQSSARNMVSSLIERRQKGRTGSKAHSGTRGTNAVIVQEFNTGEYAELQKAAENVLPLGSESGSVADVFGRIPLKWA